MQEIEFELGGVRRTANLADGRSIAIDLDFDGPQPLHFGVNPATRRPVVAGEFVGRTAQGSSCNVDQIQLVPHCNGTHTETVSHIIDQRVPIAAAAMDGLFTGMLVSIEPVPAGRTEDAYRPPLEPEDRVITRQQIQDAVHRNGIESPQCLIVRTLPNETGKRRRVYDADNQPPFYSCEAMLWIKELGIDHLLVDLPSIDRIHDHGLLTNHHLFWDVPEGTHCLAAETTCDKTITEMVYVPDDLKDGVYLVNLQVAPLCSDASPSRPLLFPVTIP